MNGVVLDENRTQEIMDYMVERGILNKLEDGYVMSDGFLNSFGNRMKINADKHPEMGIEELILISLVEAYMKKLEITTKEKAMLFSELAEHIAILVAIVEKIVEMRIAFDENRLRNKKILVEENGKVWLDES